jgi:rare lipoprotein A
MKRKVLTILLMLVGFAVSITEPAAPKPILTKVHVGNSIQKSRRVAERGLASWYGEEFDQQTTSSGETFDMYELTAAHPTLPFGTIVRVTNLRNGKHVDVRIIDRGPFVEGRIIDLSLAAAEFIDMVNSGVARVKVEIISGRQHATSR